MHARSWLLLAAAAFAATSTGCGNAGNAGTSASNKSAEGTNAAGDKPNADVGTSLYKAAPAIEATKTVANKAGEPLVIPNCTVQYEDRQQVAAEVDGKIDLLATPLDAGAGFDPKDPNIVFHPRDTKRETPFRKLNEGDRVKIGQVICILDDQLIVTKRDAAMQNRTSASEMFKAATDGAKLTKDKLKLTEEAVRRGSGSMADYLGDQITLTRFLENLAQANQTISKADAEYKEATVMLGKHLIKSSVNGVVRTIVKRPGEFVKAGDKILEVQADDKVRVEGNVDVQYAALVKDVLEKRFPVTVEPALPSAPVRSHAWHRQEVTGVAVTQHPSPLIVSTSSDGSAIVWDPNLNHDPNHKPVAHTLPHPVAVRCVATGVAGGKIIAVTGADDGKVRVWDLTNPANLPTAPTREPIDAHTSGVQAIAFSPDGKYAATAAGREIFIWKADTAEKLYALPSEHRDAVTSLSFTPQCTLISAAKDRTLKVWKLGEKQGTLARTIDHRSGAVDVLGVSKDGSRVLFDQDKGRIDIVNPTDKQTIGSIQNMGSTAAFSTLALFNPDESLIVTAGGEGELKGGLQVWTTPPAGGRGSEVARLFTPGRVGATCAGFSSVKGVPFLVVGTASGTVHVWSEPTDLARAKSEGRVTYIDSTDPRNVTVRVELDNSVLKLLDRSAATVIIPTAP